jgi:hypothetical protein
MRWLLGRNLTANIGVSLLPVLRVGLLVLTAGIVGGLLFTLGFVGLFAALFMFLQDQGLAATPSFLIVTGVIFVLAVAVVITSQRIFRRHLEVIAEKPAPLSREPMDIEDIVLDLPRVVVSNFLSGIMGESESRTYRSH